MRWNGRSLNDFKLYLILDTEVADYTRLLAIAQKCIGAGVDLIQLRDKKGSAKEILQFSRLLLNVLSDKIPFIINDRVDLAIASRAAGVHLGQNDMPLAIARKIMGKKAVIGASCQTFEHAQEAVNAGADYIGFGSVFKTLTKPEREPMDLRLLVQVVRKIRIPVFAIGGINQERVAVLHAVGTERIAVCRSVCSAADPERSIKALRAALNKH